MNDILIKGKNLNEHQRKLVLSSFIFRPTVEARANLQFFYNFNKNQHLIHDSEWIEQQAFWFTGDGLSIAKFSDHNPQCFPVIELKPVYHKLKHTGLFR